jgi:hypothetical protein
METDLALFDQVLGLTQALAYASSSTDFTERKLHY